MVQLSELEIAITSGKPRNVRDATISYLREHRDWYEKWSTRYMWLWNSATASIVVISAATAILAAWNRPYLQWLNILLPAISTVLGTLLMQFRMRDMWQLREMGRIASEELVAEAHLMDVGKVEDATKTAIALRMRAHQIERDQATQFFAEPPNKEGGSKPNKEGGSK